MTFPEALAKKVYEPEEMPKRHWLVEWIFPRPLTTFEKVLVLHIDAATPRDRR